MLPGEFIRLVGGEVCSRVKALKTLKTLTMLAAGGTIASAATAGYAFGVEPSWIELVPVSLTLARLAPAFDGYRIVLFSDIHLGDGLDRDRLEGIVASVNEQRPDLVAIAGDFVSSEAWRHAPDLAPLGRLVAADGVVAVPGNHDYSAGIGPVRRALASCGIRELTNAVYTIRRGVARLHVAGVDDVMARKARLDLVLDALPAEGGAIMLAHEPDFADISAATGRFDAQLSGHSHGGQVRVPFIGPLVLPAFAKRYPSGRYQVGDMIQYTTRGVGTELVPVRFACRPEISVITLRVPAPTMRHAESSAPDTTRRASRTLARL